ncbi:MAG: histidine kinase [Actinomycetota bacterium]|nr:histidine kinase [Actinomycetota bacterium]
MRRRLSLLVGATTSAVVLAFLIPLALLLRNLAEARALSDAASQNQPALAVANITRDLARNPGQAAGTVGAKAAGVTSLYLPDGTVIGQGPADPGVDEARRVQQPVTRNTADGGAVVYSVLLTQRGPIVARTEVSRSQLHEGVPEATAIVTVLGLAVLVVAMLTADQIGNGVARPIRELARSANALRDGHLDTRVPERGAPEVVALATALNQLAARVEQLLAAERDAVADLAHRLRTPVTALRLDADTISDPEVAEVLRQHVGQLERTVDAIVHDAKRPTRAGANKCDVGKVVTERVAFWSALAEEQGREMRMSVPQDRPLRAPLDAADLSDVVDVLIDNVFAHTEEGIPLEVWVAPRADGAVVLTVEDGGEGLPQADIIARGVSGGGSTGLGMDIVRRAANASGGRMEVGRSRLGGALIRVVLGPGGR